MLGVHAPDGFLEPRVAIVTALLAVLVVAAALRKTSTHLGDRQVPLSGMTAAFVFAAQMVNFPIGAGTSGHLVGGALAAVLLGPWVGVLVVSVVVLVQALVFADGGITALGYNTLNMAVVPAFAGWGLFRVFRRALPRNATGVAAASALAAGVSVVLAAAAFSLEWLFGASAPVAFDTVFAAMVGVHTLIGVGEGVITGLVIAAVLAARPDLVAGAADLSADERAGAARMSSRAVGIAAVLVTLFLAMAASQFASDAPDGLNAAAERVGIGDPESDQALDDAIFAGYATRGIDNPTTSLAIAGLTGVTLTALVGYGMVGAGRLTAARSLR